MKIVTTVLNFLFTTAGILLGAFVATFFLSVFMPENVQNALEIFEKFFIGG